MSNTTKTRSDSKRDAIICAAKKAFQTYGVTGTSMDKLAEMANVSKRTVYNHFPAKENIVMHLIRSLWSKTMTSVNVKYEQGGDLHAQLSAILLAEIKLITGNEYIELVRVSFGHFFYHPEKLREEIEQWSAQETVLKRWLKDASESGALCIDDMDAAMTVLSSQIKGQCFWPQIMRVQSPLSAKEKQMIADQTAAIFLCYYRNQSTE